jgi:hypothetical protein
MVMVCGIYWRFIIYTSLVTGGHRGVGVIVGVRVGVGVGLGVYVRATEYAQLGFMLRGPGFVAIRKLESGPAGKGGR